MASIGLFSPDAFESKQNGKRETLMNMYANAYARNYRIDCVVLSDACVNGNGRRWDDEKSTNTVAPIA